MDQARYWKLYLFAGAACWMLAALIIGLAR